MATVDSGRLRNNRIEIARLVSNLQEKYPELPKDKATDLVLRFDGNERGIENHILGIQAHAIATTSSTQNFPAFSLNDTSSILTEAAVDNVPLEAVYSRDRVQSERIFAHSSSSQSQAADPRLAASYPWFPVSQNYSLRPSAESSSNPIGYGLLTSPSAERSPYTARDNSRHDYPSMPDSSQIGLENSSVFNNSFNSSSGSLSDFHGTVQRSDVAGSQRPYAMASTTAQHFGGSSAVGIEMASQEQLHERERQVRLPTFHPEQPVDLSSSIHHKSDVQLRSEEERLKQQKIRYDNISKVYLALGKELGRVRTDLSNSEKRILGNECAKNPTQNDVKALMENTALLRAEVITMMDELDKFGDTALIGAEEPMQAKAVAGLPVDSQKVKGLNDPISTVPLVYQQPAVPPPSYEHRTLYPLAHAHSFQNDPPPQYNSLSPGPLEGNHSAPGAAGGSAVRNSAPDRRISEDEVEPDGKWNCPRCTFSNHIALPECEVCEWKRT